MISTVMPAKAGIRPGVGIGWIPAFAGMTLFLNPLLVGNLPKGEMLKLNDSCD